MNNLGKTWNFLPLSKEVWESLQNFSDIKHTPCGIKVGWESGGVLLVKALPSWGPPVSWTSVRGLRVGDMPPRGSFSLLESSLASKSRLTLPGNTWSQAHFGYKTPKAAAAMGMRWVRCTVARPVINKDMGHMAEVGRAGRWPGKRQ